MQKNKTTTACKTKTPQIANELCWQIHVILGNMSAGSFQSTGSQSFWKKTEKQGRERSNSQKYINLKNTLKLKEHEKEEKKN